MKLYGLALAGGKSLRMGFDKAFLDFHGEPQVSWLNNLLAKFCDRVFVSGTSEKIPGDFKFIPDYYETGGPMNGILSARRLHPTVAWLVVPVDMPYLDQDAISFLIQSRDENKFATCFSQSKAVEPFPVILEPSAFPTLINHFRQGNTSMNDFLRSNDVMKTEVPDPSWLLNINFPDQLQVSSKASFNRRK